MYRFEQDLKHRARNKQRTPRPKRRHKRNKPSWLDATATNLRGSERRSINMQLAAARHLPDTDVHHEQPSVFDLFEKFVGEAA